MSEGGQLLDLSQPYCVEGPGGRNLNAVESELGNRACPKPNCESFSFSILLFALNTHPTTSTAFTTPRITVNSAYIHRKLYLLPSQKVPAILTSCVGGTSQFPPSVS